MEILFNLLALVGGLCLFLFGMNVMGQALERSAGNKLESMLGRLTTNRATGLLTGMGVTAVIQSSSATTVMVVGFVNSGIMTLRQSINVIMGANIGTTITSWILSLGGLSEDNIVLRLLKPTSFTPILALLGIALYMFSKKSRRKDIGTILLGFAVLMFGMDAMSDSVSFLTDPKYGLQDLFTMFNDPKLGLLSPILGVLVGAAVTALIQSSSAAVGILQAVAVASVAAEAAGNAPLLTVGAIIPIIMGQNIGTTITALLSSFGTNKNAKRAALVHLSFNVIGTLFWLIVFCVLNAFIPRFFAVGASAVDVAIYHSIFNVLCTLLLLPMSRLLEKLAYKLVPEGKKPEIYTILDDRLLGTPSIALERCHALAVEMAESAAGALKDSIKCLEEYNSDLAASVRDTEDKTDKYEDLIGSFLVKLSSKQLGDRDSAEATTILKVIGDFERISDHAVNILESAEELKEKGISFSEDATAEMRKMCDATIEIVELSYKAFAERSIETASLVEPLEQIIDFMKEHLRTQHILRLQSGSCSIAAGFVWSDLLTNLERTSDHCSNVAGCIIDANELNLNLHQSLKTMKSDSPFFKEQYQRYAEKYLIGEEK